MKEEISQQTDNAEVRVKKLLDETDLGKSCSNLKEWIKNIEKIPGYQITEDISTILKLIDNPIRLKIILILLEREWACNCEFEYAFSQHQALISHHLKLLREGNLITFSQSGSWKYYKIKDEKRENLVLLRDLLIKMK